MNGIEKRYKIILLLHMLWARRSLLEIALVLVRFDISGKHTI